MGEPRDMDELLAQAERVDAAPHTTRRAVGLATALVAAGAAAAIVATGSARGILAAILWLITLGGSPPLD
ncbi:hypothetical protein ACVKXF_003002 [Curtobacterium sp. PvP017]|uniref:Uncharacterized protein n=1 Tax=Curtobacterium citreum TaxID=2036 RepID=A0ABU8Y7W9_9MICO|nr:hypothetical protein [Curtobacterium sp. JUb34]ROR31010.1 hypothetical protein EDF63_2442 [Curtobacterium sp. JUb34]